MIAVEAAALAAALRRMKVGRPGGMAIISGVRLIAADGQLECWRTDLDLTITTVVPCGAGELDVIVPATTLTNFVGNLEGPVALGMLDGELVVEGRRAHAVLPTLPEGDWPLVTHAEGDEAVLTGADIAAIRSVLYAVSTDAVRPTLRGINLTGEYAQATDSYRLAQAECTTAGVGIVPPSTFADLADGATIAVDSNRVTVRTPESTRTTRLIEGGYPAFERLIGDPPVVVVDIDRDALIGAIEVVAADAVASRVRLRFEKKELVVSTRDQNGSRLESRIDCPSEIDAETGLNRTYLLDILKAVPEPTVSLGYRSELKPISIEAGPVFHMLMPIRLLGS